MHDRREEVFKILKLHLPLRESINHSSNGEKPTSSSIYTVVKT